MRRAIDTAICGRGPRPIRDFGVDWGLERHSPNSAEIRKNEFRGQAEFCGAGPYRSALSELREDRSQVLGDCTQRAVQELGQSAASGEACEVPQRRVAGFLHGFGHRHQGRLAGLEVANPRIGILVIAANRALEAIGIESADGHERVVICLSGHLTYFVSKPKRVLLRTAHGGVDRGLEIESADGTTTAVRLCDLRRPAPN